MITQELREEVVERFINNVLPHGSGIDCDWRVSGTGFENYYSQGKIGKDSSKYVYFNNSYHSGSCTNFGRYSKRNVCSAIHQWSV